MTEEPTDQERDARKVAIEAEWTEHGVTFWMIHSEMTLICFLTDEEAEVLGEFLLEQVEWRRQWTPTTRNHRQ